MAAQALSPEAPAQHRTLRESDRCDRCGAQAFVRAKLGGSDLLFCGHHGGTAFDALVQAGAIIVDERRFIPA